MSKKNVEKISRLLRGKVKKEVYNIFSYFGLWKVQRKTREKSNKKKWKKVKDQFKINKLFLYIILNLFYIFFFFYIKIK